jgi:hypothetical protein
METSRIPDKVIAYLGREYLGNVHDHEVADVTSRWFEKETVGPIHTRGHVITGLISLGRRLLI